MPENVKDEMNELRAMHRELMQSQRETNGKLGDLVAEVKVMIRDGAEIKEVVKDHEKRIRKLQDSEAQNRPFMKLFESLNTKLWFIIVSVIAGAIAVVTKMQ